MNDDTRRMIYGTVIAFLFFIVVWLGFVYVSACGFTLTCIQASQLVERTPIPTLIPREHSEAQPGVSADEIGQCPVAATDLIGAWVSAGSPESEAFPFTDVNGQECEGSFADIRPLFVENSLWFPGSLGCVSCHNAELTERSAGLDLSSYETIAMGTRRVPEATSPGTDIFGGGDLEKSLLYQILVNQGLMPEGHSPDAAPRQPVLYAGRSVADAEATATP